MFYSRLKEICKEKNTTVTALIKKLNLSSGNLSKWKKGVIPKSKTISEIAEYLDVSVDYLLGYTPKMEIADERQKIIDLVKSVSPEEAEIIYNVAKSVLETVRKYGKN